MRALQLLELSSLAWWKYWKYLNQIGVKVLEITGWLYWSREVRSELWKISNITISVCQRFHTTDHTSNHTQQTQYIVEQILTSLPFWLSQLRLSERERALLTVNCLSYQRQQRQQRLEWKTM